MPKHPDDLPTKHHVNGYDVLVVDVNPIDWVVQCQNRDCTRKIGVAKQMHSEPQPRGCIDHPPSTWS